MKFEVGTKAIGSKKGYDEHKNQIFIVTEGEIIAKDSEGFMQIKSDDGKIEGYEWYEVHTTEEWARDIAAKAKAAEMGTKEDPLYRGYLEAERNA